MVERIGWANSVTQLGCGFEVLVGGGEGVTDGTGVLLTVGVKLETGVSVDAIADNVGVGCGKKVLHDEVTSIMVVRIRETNFILEYVPMESNLHLTVFPIQPPNGLAHPTPGQASRYD